jgi:ring-1,2-phenylacetyl-CoA epoxidase subunit PaaE
VPGAVLDVMTPTGRFFTHLEPSQAKHYALLAAGSGITPILSIAATVLDHEPDSTVTLLYGNRTTSSIMFLEELEDLKNRYPTRFALFHVLSREAAEAELLHGRLDGAKLGVFLDHLLPVDTVDEWFPVRAVRDGRDRAQGASPSMERKPGAFTSSSSTSKASRSAPARRGR